MNNRKKRRIKHLLTLSTISISMIVVLGSCNIGDFGETNQDPTVSTDIKPENLFTTAQLNMSNHDGMQRMNLSYGGTIVQQVSSPLFPGEFYRTDRGGLTQYWNQAWGDQVQLIVSAINKLETLQEDGDNVANKLAVARILKSFMFYRLTDTYGDIPYSKAGKGYLDSEFTPSYDSQQEIYNDIFNELDEAVKQFDSSQPTIGEADLVYNGDIPKWEKFANSLRLIMAMRLINVDAAKAEQEAQAAINASGGVMTSNDDIYAVPHEQGANGPVHTNSTGEFYSVINPIYVSQTLVDWLLNRDDPRLAVYGAVLKDDQVITDPNQQLGRPNGYTDAELESHPSWTGNLNDYTQLHPRFLDRYTPPTILLNHAQVEFMLAEVAVRWGISPNSAASHYNAGVRAAMNHVSLFSGDTDIPDSEINNYLVSNPFNATGTDQQKLEQTNEQYWAATFIQGWSAWTNFRRIGYPDLEPAPVDDPNPHPQSDTGNDFPKRFVYPAEEENLNAESYNAVIDRQGPNDIGTAVWWDVN